MSDIRVKVSGENLLKVRVGQQNSVKVISSLTGQLAGIATYSDISGKSYYSDKSGISTNVIGGIASVTKLYVSGISTFESGITYPFGDFDPPNGVAYFDNDGTLVSSASTNSPVVSTSYILGINDSGIPVWSNTIDGGTY